MIVAAIGSNVLVKAYLINGAVFSCLITLASQFVMYSLVTWVILSRITKKFEIEKKEETVKE